MGCNECEQSFTRVYIRMNEFQMDQESDLYEALVNDAGFNKIQVNGMLLSMKMQKQMKLALKLNSVPDPIIYSGTDHDASKLSNIFSSKSIPHYIIKSNKLVK
jgi:hypothetical protein